MVVIGAEEPRIVLGQEILEYTHLVRIDPYLVVAVLLPDGAVDLLNVRVDEQGVYIVFRLHRSSIWF